MPACTKTENDSPTKMATIYTSAGQNDKNSGLEPHPASSEVGEETN